MGRIVAIGGGRIGTQTKAIDREIIALTGRKRPRTLFVPTASRDNVAYGERFARAYGRLGCRCDVLYLLGQVPSRRAIAERIAAADIIYVGGGNTLLMMRRWRFLGAMRGYGHDPWEYIRVTGLGLVKGTVCPHFHHDDREKDFLAMIARMGGFGIGIDDRCALEVVDGRYRVLQAGRGAKAWTVRRHRGKVIVREIPLKKSLRPMAEIYAD